MAATHTMDTVSSPDGTEIAFARAGSGPPLVLVHGTGSDHTGWMPVLPALAEHATVYAMDRRGWGESSDAAEYELEREFEDVVAVVDSIDEPVVLLGHSHGALCSMEAALRTDNLRALILYEPPIPIGDHELYQEDELAELKTLIDEGKDEQALVFFLSKIAGVSSAQIDAFRSAPNWQAGVDAAHTTYRETKEPGSYDFNPARFEPMTTPTLLMTGSESPQKLTDAVESVGDALPDSRTVVFEGHDHVAHVTASERFIHEVLAVIQESS